MEPTSLSGLSIRKSSLLLLALAIFLATEVFGGGLRYYLDQGGLSVLVYVGKLALLTCVAARAVTLVTSPTFWAVLVLMCLSSVLAFAHGATILNVGFAIFVYTPLIFGLLYAESFSRAFNRLALIVCIGWIICIIGVAVDMSTMVPWEGYSYSLAGVDLEANREWWDQGVDRVAGFSRLSTILATMLAVFALYLHHTSESRIARTLLFALTLAGLLVTTNKSAVPGYLIGLSSAWFFQRSKASNVLFGVTVAIGLLLPLVSILFSYSNVFQFGELFNSLDKRISVTWPGFFDIIERRNGVMFGTGFGTVGAPAAAFPITELQGNRVGSLGVADNTALYMWGMLGLVGVLAYLGLFLVLHQLRRTGTNHARGLVSVTLCLVMISWTTDILEMAVASMFLGLATGTAFPSRTLRDRFKKGAA